MKSQYQHHDAERSMFIYAKFRVNRTETKVRESSQHFRVASSVIMQTYSTVISEMASADPYFQHKLLLYPRFFDTPTAFPRRLGMYSALRFGAKVKRYFCMLSAHTEAPELAQITVGTDLLQALKVAAQLRVHAVGQYLLGRHLKWMSKMD